MDKEKKDSFSEELTRFGEGLWYYWCREKSLPLPKVDQKPELTDEIKRHLDAALAGELNTLIQFELKTYSADVVFDKYVPHIPKNKLFWLFEFCHDPYQETSTGRPIDNKIQEFSSLFFELLDLLKLDPEELKSEFEVQTISLVFFPVYDRLFRKEVGGTFALITNEDIEENRPISDEKSKELMTNLSRLVNKKQSPSINPFLAFLLLLLLFMFLKALIKA